MCFVVVVVVYFVQYIHLCFCVMFATKKKQFSNLSNYLILFIMCKLHNYISRTLKFQKTTALKRRLDIKNYI